MSSQSGLVLAPHALRVTINDRVDVVRLGLKGDAGDLELTELGPRRTSLVFRFDAQNSKWDVLPK